VEDQGHAFSLEALAGEFTVMASLRVINLEAKGNQHARNEAIRRGRSLKGLGVMAVRIETRRSIPGQGEAGRKPGGGLRGF
jgi:hypothetical protein